VRARKVADGLRIRGYTSAGPACPRARMTFHAVANDERYPMIRPQGLGSHFSTESDLVLWSGSFLVAIALHAAAVIGFQPNRSEGDTAGDPTIMIDMDEVAAAPNQGQSEATPGPEQIQIDQISEASVAQEEVPEHTEKEQQEAEAPKLDAAKAPEPEVVPPEVKRTADTKPQEETKEKQTEKEHQAPSEARPESAPTSSPQAEPVKATEVTASTGAPIDDTAALVTWRSRLAAHVQRFKRYPAEALDRHLHGTALVRFTIDRAGAVIAAELVGRSGIEVLDRESLSLISRAAPLPAAPVRVAGTHFTFTIPVRFHPQQ
jgi:periplasmic protein TonB